MKIVLAFDSFKGCMSAADACSAAAEGILQYDNSAEVLSFPLSDGGEGLVLCLQNSKSIPLKEVFFDAHDPLMRPIRASYVVTLDGKTAYMEMAATSGLTLLSETERNPMIATTYGVGEMILDALHRGVKQIVLGIGGSATCDGGKGMLEALGVSFDNPQKPQLGDVKIVVACDVDNPLYGPQGASYVFAPQKGASPEQVEMLDERLRAFARLTESKTIASPQMVNTPGAGAAGGLGYALVAYLDATLQRGIDIVLEALDFSSSLPNAHLVITGEGKSDAQTLMGKVSVGVLKRSQQQDIPVLLLSGAVEDVDALMSAGFQQVASINEGDNRPLPILMQREVAMRNLRNTIVEILKNCNIK